MSTMTTEQALWSYEITQTAPQTSVANESSLAITHQERGAARHAWADIIDLKLVEWGRNPDQLEEEELLPPSRAAIDSAVRIAMTFRDCGVYAPNRVVPDGDGGIVLERWSGSFSESFEIFSDGQIEYVSCRDHHVVERLPIQIC